MAVPQPKLKLTVGDVVADRYRIDGVVGRGGFGAVYQATQLGSGRGVALKVLLKNFSRGKTDSKRFRREAALVQRLRHPNVVALLDYGATRQGQPFIAFELLTGESLSSVLKARGPVSLERATEIARGVLHALYAAHTLGIIHRDIKPGNVFLCDDSQGIKVLDFGIAKAVTGEDANVTQLTEAGQMIGTPQYMAPEQVRGTGVYPATDLYALGLVMAEMLTGKKVVQSPALLDVYMQHIDDRPFELPPIVQESPLAPVIQRAVAKVLDLRYATAGEMIADLDAAVPPPPSAEPLSARTIEMASRPGLSDPLEMTAAMDEDPEPAVGDHDATELVEPPAGTVVMDRPEQLDGLARAEPLPDSSDVATADRHAGHGPVAGAAELVGPEVQATRDSWPAYPIPGGPPAPMAAPSAPGEVLADRPSYPVAVPSEPGGVPADPPSYPMAVPSDPGALPADRPSYPMAVPSDPGGAWADRPSYPVAVPSAPELGAAAPPQPAPMTPPAASHGSSGDYLGLHEPTYGDEEYEREERAHFRSGLLIVVIVFVLAVVIMGLVWWAPWDAAAPRGPSDWHLAMGALLATGRFC